MKNTVVVILLMIALLCGCGKKKMATIEPPVSEPAEVPQTPAVRPPDNPAPKQAPVAPVPKGRMPSVGDTSALKLVESGVKKMNAGSTEEAESLFEQALRVSPTNGRPYYYLGVIAAGQRDYDRASGFFAQAETHLHADSFWMSQILLQQGLILKNQNQKSAAAEKFRKAVETNPSNNWAKSELDAITRQ